MMEKYAIDFLNKRGYFINKINYQYLYNSFVETFVKRQYHWLVQNLKPYTIAIDFGAQAGDSAFYLFYEGKGKIKEVLAYEPDKTFFDLLVQNIEFAHAQTVIKPIPHIAPEPFINTENKKNIIIKCDIEGAEHRVFTKDADLTEVYKLQIEYHGTSRNLPRILKSKGFKVKVGGPWTIDPVLGDVGWLYAWR